MKMPIADSVSPKSSPVAGAPRAPSTFLAFGTHAEEDSLSYLMEMGTFAPGKKAGPRLVALCLLGVLLFPSGCNSPPEVCGLRPIYPDLQWKSPSPMRGKVPGLAYPKVDSLQPILQWETFPRDLDLKRDLQGFLQEARNIAYDLRIWVVKEDEPSEEVYARKGLPIAAHRLESALQPRTKYFWTVRARFEINGQPRVSEWGFTGPEPWLEGELSLRRRGQIPPGGYYRFITP